MEPQLNINQIPDVLHLREIMEKAGLTHEQAEGVAVAIDKRVSANAAIKDLERAKDTLMYSIKASEDRLMAAMKAMEERIMTSMESELKILKLTLTIRLGLIVVGALAFMPKLLDYFGIY